MTIDATFWVMISFFIFIGLIIYFKIPQKIKTTLDENINDIKNQIDEADKLKEDAKNILTEHEKKISNSKAEVRLMVDQANEDAEKNVIKTKIRCQNWLHDIGFCLTRRNGRYTMIVEVERLRIVECQIAVLLVLLMVMSRKCT